MDREEQDVVPIPEGGLGPVPVVHIPVKNRYLAPLSGREVCGEGDVVEDTEPHGMVDGSMVSWRPHEGDTGACATIEESMTEIDTRPRGGQSGRPASRANGRFGAEIPSAGLGDEPDSVYVVQTVDARQLVDLGEAHRNAWQGRESGQIGQYLEPRLALRMPNVWPVFEENGV